MGRVRESEERVTVRERLELSKQLLVSCWHAVGGVAIIVKNSEKNIFREKIETVQCTCRLVVGAKGALRMRWKKIV